MARRPWLSMCFPHPLPLFRWLMLWISKGPPFCSSLRNKVWNPPIYSERRGGRVPDLEGWAWFIALQPLCCARTLLLSIDILCACYWDAVDLSQRSADASPICASVNEQESKERGPEAKNHERVFWCYYRIDFACRIAWRGGHYKQRKSRFGHTKRQPKGRRKGQNPKEKEGKDILFSYRVTIPPIILSCRCRRR